MTDEGPLVDNQSFLSDTFKSPLFDRENTPQNAPETSNSYFEDIKVSDSSDQKSNEQISAPKSEDNSYSLFVDISDALCERNKVKYTIHTKTTFPEFSKKDVFVIREYDEFIWLHNCLEDNEDYAGFIIPPAPPRPDFDSSREKLQKLGEGESTLTKEEFQKMKQELEQEYLANFKKTVAMHELFLTRLAAHPVFRKDTNFHVFLGYESDLSVRSRNKKELVECFIKRVTKTADEVLLSGQKDVDEFFINEKNYLCEYHIHIKEAADRADKNCSLRKSVAEFYSKLAIGLDKLSRFESACGNKHSSKLFSKVVDCLEKLKKAESRAATDEELKEADTLRYFCREIQSGKDLLYRRTRFLANYEAANKNLERCRARNREVLKAESDQSETCRKFEEISSLARSELTTLKRHRVETFKKNIAELADLEIKQSKNKLLILQNSLKAIKELE